MCHAYMYGLGGAENGKRLKNYGFFNDFEGVKVSTSRFGKRAVERVEPLLSHFGATLVSLWVYSGDFGSLYDYFGIIVELLWV